eukprot:CAMPEP_0167822014 /NCGR_PEP_ID=MMETSP0112_2-20121227/7198_1 /TAXON_ID=91324 /ORGANISM="Lotharella globosa, Strain CCCM811" /LENGTH=647 /DNA_ID=CAMNT_0007723209 /DNA_START=343 /DNA_END=2286 /DNA_ORIENTATION=+
MAYGQTGAGKTFTMMGGTQNYKYRGIAPRAVAHVFRHIQTNPQVAITVRISYLEVYNEQFFDLLQENTRLQDLAVMDDAQGNVSVKGLSMKTATSEEEALNLLFEGETNRAIAEHQMNKNSTRSHCIFTMHLDIRSRIESSEKVVKSKLNLVDLAGSERVKNTGSSGKTLQEANYINKSLTFLEQVVIALSSKGRDHIPFRQSKLTNVLRDSLGGNCKTRLIANIWIEARHIHETVSTLKFATRMMRVANTPTINERQDPAMLLKKYKRQIRELKQELAMHDSLANRNNIQYDDFTPEQRQEAYEQVAGYLEDKIPEIKIVSVRQIQELFRQFKEYVRKNGGSAPAVAMEVSKGAGAKSAAGDGDVKSQQGAANQAKEAGVGEVDGAGGFHLGEADAGAAPPEPEGSAPSQPGEDLKTAHGDTKHASSPKSTNPKPAPSKTMDKAPSEEEAFEDYKKNQGQSYSQQFEENKKDYQAKKLELKELSNQVNKLKGEIDKMASELEEVRAGADTQAMSPDGIPVIDEHEFSIIRNLKAKKKSYQAAFHKRKMVKNEVSYMKSLVKQSKLKLCSQFLDWYRATYGEQQPTINSQKKESAQKAADDDVLDDGEKFDALERQRIMEEDPDSLAFFNARKTMMATMKRKKLSRK